MLRLAKTALLSVAFIALTAYPASAQLTLQRAQCESAGGHIVANKCEMPAQQGGPRTGAPQAAPQTEGRGEGRGAPQGNPQQGRGAPQANVQQGNPQQGNGQRGNDQPNGGRGPGQQQGVVQQAVPPQGNDRNAQRGNDRNNNNVVQRGNNQRGNDRNNNFGNNGPARNFDQNAFNRRYYGRYGNDPNNFERDRLRFRAQQQWRERYPHDYVYADDSFYRDCRTDNQVGGAIVGAILGGLLGNAVSNGQGGATIAGLILGGAGGAAVARNLDCEDRSYVYRTYYDGFERGRRQSSYQWRNDRTGDYGTLLVGDYYQDRDNYRCATYTQTIYVHGTPQIGRGHACRQEDGTWAFVD